MVCSVTLSQLLWKTSWKSIHLWVLFWAINSLWACVCMWVTVCIVPKTMSETRVGSAIHHLFMCSSNQSRNQSTNSGRFLHGTIWKQTKENKEKHLTENISIKNNLRNNACAGNMIDLMAQERKIIMIHHHPKVKTSVYQTPHLQSLR